MIIVKAGGGEGLDMEAVCADVAALVRQGEQVVLLTEVRAQRMESG